jgi:hypothetical protein
MKVVSTAQMSKQEEEALKQVLYLPSLFLLDSM